MKRENPFWGRLLVSVILAGATAAGFAQSPQLQLTIVSDAELFAPVGITNAKDGSGRLFVVDQRGEIRIIRNGSLEPQPFLDIGSKLVPERANFDERGLLGLAFHPDYTTPAAPGEGKFYVYYSAPSPAAPGTASDPVDHMSVVAEYQVSVGDPDLADPLSERILLTIDEPQFNHDGGQLGFGPLDGLLYISTGDGGSSNDNNAGHTGGDGGQPDGVLGNSQDRTNLLGKILRVDPFGTDGAGGEYGIPGTNPFVGAGGGVREEIYAYGLRNPWRFSFDDGPGGTNRFFLADVGQGKVEEVNLIESGRNYGWRNKEGTFDFDATAPTPVIAPTDPIAQYAHPNVANGLEEIGISVTGGVVYRGSAIPELVGRYIFGDWSTSFGTPNGTLLQLEETSPGTFALSHLDIVGGNPIGRYVQAFGAGEDGEIYIATKRSRTVTGTDPETGLPTGTILKLEKAPKPKLQLRVVVDQQLFAPVGITNANDGSGRLFVVDQRGQIRIIANKQLLPQPFLDIGSKLVPERANFDERGLLGLAFHPDYTTPAAAGEGKFYVYYSAPSPDAPGTASDPVDHMSVVAEYTVSASDADVADSNSERILLTFNQPQFNHDGGQLGFGPEDGLLYISTGDGGSSNDNNAGHTGGDGGQPDGVLGNSQDRTNLLGKMHRIDPFGTDGPGGQYGIPGDNPFVGEGGGIREEIYAYGLRNPWRFSFDDGPGGTNRLYLADVGQGKVEEVNLIERGENYGWRNKEGTFDFDVTAPAPVIAPTDPIAQYAHPNVVNGLEEIGISVTGGVVYRGSAIPSLVGRYVFGDWSTSFGTPNGTLLQLEEISAGSFVLTHLDIAGGNPIGRYVQAFGAGEDGEVYIATKQSRTVTGTDPDSGLPTGTILKLELAEDPEVVSLGASKDTTIHSENDNSNGSGPVFFSGKVGASGGGAVRRALLAFPVDSTLPAGATVLDATLTLRVAQAGLSTSFSSALHVLTADWGVGASSTAGGLGAPPATDDATWNQRFWDADPAVPWTTAGGDFVATASATTPVGPVGSYEWNAPAMVDEVQAWLDDPAGNFGWILVTDESMAQSAKKYTSSDAGSNQPSLEVLFIPPPALTNRESWERMFYLPGEFTDDLSDDDGDGLQLLLEYGLGLDPTVFNQLESVLTFTVDEGADTFTISFRRDPRATDLVYQVQVGSDLENWDVIAESIAGAPFTGTGTISEDPEGSGSAFILVSVGDPVGVDAGLTRFARVVVIEAP